MQHEHNRPIPKPKSWEPTDQDQENSTKYETRITCVHEYDGEEREVVGPGVGGQGRGDPTVQNETGDSPVHNVHFVKYDVTVSFMAQVLDTVAYFVSHVLVVDTVTYCDIFW